MTKDEQFEIWLIARERVVLQELWNLRAHLREMEEKEKALSAKAEILKQLIRLWEAERGSR